MIDTIYNPRAHDEADPAPPVTIRRMRLEDIEHVSRLERRCYSVPWSSSAYVTEIGNPNAYYTVAINAGGILVGYSGMWIIMDEAHLTTIAVDPEHRGLKIGERLLLDMLDYGMAHGAERATLEVREHNVAAHNLYLKYGFVDVAARKKYYSDNGENALIMWQNDLFDKSFTAFLQGRKRDLLGK